MNKLFRLSAGISLSLLPPPISIKNELQSPSAEISLRIIPKQYGTNSPFPSLRIHPTKSLVKSLLLFLPPFVGH
jgi:hypothetical protein